MVEEGQRHPMCLQRSGVAFKPAVQVMHYEGQRVAGFVDVPSQEGFLYLGELSSQVGQRVALDDHAGKPPARHSHDSVATTVREQFDFNVLHRTIQPQDRGKSTSESTERSARATLRQWTPNYR